MSQSQQDEARKLLAYAGLHFAEHCCEPDLVADFLRQHDAAKDAELKAAHESVEALRKQRDGAQIAAKHSASYKHRAEQAEAALKAEKEAHEKKIGRLDALRATVKTFEEKVEWQNKRIEEAETLLATMQTAAELESKRADDALAVIKTCQSKEIELIHKLDAIEWQQAHGDNELVNAINRMQVQRDECLQRCKQMEAAIRAERDTHAAGMARVVEALNLYGDATGMGKRPDDFLQRLGAQVEGVSGRDEALAEIVKRSVLRGPAAQSSSEWLEGKIERAKAEAFEEAGLICRKIVSLESGSLLGLAKDFERQAAARRGKR